MLIRDIYDSSANGLLSKLRAKLAKAQSVRHSAVSGGDYEQTVTAYVRTLHAAINAVEKQATLERAQFSEPTE